MTKINGKKFWVEARMRRGQVLGYGVYDSVGGMVSEQAYYEIGPHYTADVALHLANTDRDDRNSGITAESTGKANHFRLNLAGRKAVAAARR